MRKTVSLFIVLIGWSLGATTADAQLITGPRASQFTFQDTGGQTRSARVIGRYYPGRIAHPLARIDSRLDRRLLRAATLADERANARSKERCWRYVKQALLAAGGGRSYPKK